LVATTHFFVDARELFGHQLALPLLREQLGRLCSGEGGNTKNRMDFIGRQTTRVPV
jgi:hypothetical protein